MTYSPIFLLVVTLLSIFILVKNLLKKISYKEMTQFRHDPYRFQVVAEEEMFVVIVNGAICGSFSKSTSFSLPKGESQVVCYSPFLAPTDEYELCVVQNGVSKSFGNIQETKAVTFVCEQGGEIFVRFVRPSLFDNNTEVIQEVLDVFHDEKINPSFGALRMVDLKTAVCSKNVDLEVILRENKDFCHCYAGKEKETWVVLHSHCKKVAVAREHSQVYALLLRHLTKQVGSEEVSLADLFRDVGKSPAFHCLLASNFTILKKFLIKYNSHFAWFQDEKSKTTKVVTHAP